jgi:serine/threonine-protein kinase
VAVKILREDTALDALARFRREAAAVAGLRHPHIVQITDVCLASPRGAYLVMEKLEGEPLRSIVGREAPLGTSRVVSVAMQILSALTLAHARGLVHRDVKPENVFVTRTVALPDWARLLDFGLVKELHVAGEQATLTSGHTLVGTPAYMAPEQARGLPLDPRADVFAVGVCMYEMLAGRRPFSGTGTALVASICADTPPDLRAVRGDVSPALARVVERFLAKAPADRPDAAGALRLLADVAGDIPHTIDVAPRDSPARKRRPSGPARRRRRSLLALFGAVLLVTLVVGGAALAIAFHLAPRFTP